MIKQPISSKHCDDNSGVDELKLSDNPSFENCDPDNKTLIWDGKEWLSKSIEDSKDFEENNQEIICGSSDETTVDIQEYSPVFINSIVAYFLPAVYILKKSDEANLNTKESISTAILWQKRMIFLETFLFNLSLSFILIVIGVLVTFAETFNYRYV